MMVVLNPLTPKISSVILLKVCYTIILLLLQRFGIGSTDNLLTDIFLYSHYSLFYLILYWCCKEKFCPLMGVKGEKTIESEQDHLFFLQS